MDRKVEGGKKIHIDLKSKVLKIPTALLKEVKVLTDDIQTHIYKIQ